MSDVASALRDTVRNRVLPADLKNTDVPGFNIHSTIFGKEVKTLLPPAPTAKPKQAAKGSKGNKGNKGNKGKGKKK